MSWESRVPGPITSSEVINAPLLMCLRQPEWEPWIKGEIDSYTSDPVTLDVLSTLVMHLDAQVIVEVGTYRGWGTAMIAEALRFTNSRGHLWTCDPVDYEVHEVLEGLGLASYVTYHQGPLETLLPLVPEPMDLCYIDASDPVEENLRLRYLGLILPKMKAGGLVLMDDVDHGWMGAEFVKQIAGIVLPGRRGLALIQKR